MRRPIPYAALAGVLPSGVKVVRLKGDYVEMGRQYGTLLKGDLQTWANYYNTRWKTLNPQKYSAFVEAIVEGVVGLYSSASMRQFIDGMVAGSGLSRQDVLLLNQALAFDYMFSGKPIDQLPGPACTFVGVTGPVSRGHTIVGRNLDLQKPLAIRAYNNVVTLLSPTNGDHRVATFGFVGFPQGYALLNLDATVFIEYNTGNSADLGVNPELGSMDMIHLAFAAATEPTNTDAVTTAEYLRTRKLLSPTFFGVADPTHVYVVQRPMAVAGIVSHDTLGLGITAVTNLFLDPNIPGVILSIHNGSTAIDAPSQIPPRDTPARGMVRWENLVNYFGTFTGPVIDAEAVKTIISRDISAGGTFITGYEMPGTYTWCENDSTLGSVVMDLADLSSVWWLRYDQPSRDKTWDVIDLASWARLP